MHVGYALSLLSGLAAAAITMGMLRGSGLVRVVVTPKRALVIAAVGAALAMAIHLLAEMVADLAGASGPSMTRGLIEGIAACAFVALVMGIGMGHLRDLGRILALGGRLRGADEADRGRALAELEALLRARAGRRSSTKVTANLDLYGATQLLGANLFAEAELLLDHVPIERLGPRYREVHATCKAVCRLYLGDREAARAWLARVPRPSRRREMEQIHVVNDALFTVLEGRPEVALRMLGPDAEPGGAPTELERARDHARAQALAAVGDTEGAKVVLLRLLERHGRPALERAARLRGPASPIADGVLRGEAGPYR